MKLRNGKISCQIIEKPKHEVKLLSCQLSVGAWGSRVVRRRNQRGRVIKTPHCQEIEIELLCKIILWGVDADTQH